MTCWACGAALGADDLVVDEVGRASYDDGRLGLEVRVVHEDCADPYGIDSDQGIDAPIALG
jgi:hypothetical protein